MNCKSVSGRAIFITLFLMICIITRAQDNRAQLPHILDKSYFEVNIGYINYPFSAKNLAPGYNFQSVDIPHTAVRVAIAGLEINKYLSAQISYMRPVLWVKYTFNSGPAFTEETRTVWMNIAGLTLKPQLPLNKRLTVYGEGGLAIITRNGFNDMYGSIVIKDANYASVLAGGGIKYKINDRWKLMLSSLYSPENKRSNQPSTFYVASGFSYNLLPRSAEKVEKSSLTGYHYPHQMIMLGYSTNIFGYAVNRFFTEGKIPVFWAGNAYAKQGLSFNYIRNVYHGSKVFSLDWGAGISVWQSNILKEDIYTLSLFPVFKFSLLHSKPADLYFLYSLAGPTYISRIMVDGKDLGRKFTFQDYMGIGMFAGKQRKIVTELRITHYSNGNIFPSNEGLTLPLSLNLGYTF